MSVDQTVVAKRFVNRGILYLLMFALAVPFVYPLLWMFLSSFKPAHEIFATPPSLLPGDWTLQGVQNVFTVNPFARQYFNSLYIAVIVTTVTVLISAMAGYAFARIDFPLRNKLFPVIVSAIFLPHEVTIIPIFRWVSELDLINTHWPLIIPTIFGARCVMPIFVFRQFFLTLPVELEESGKLDGLSRLGIFWRIAMPLAGPAVATVVILTFLSSFNIFFEALVYIRSPELFPVAVGITRYQDTYGEPIYNSQLAATSLATIPILIVFLFAQRQFVEGLSRTGIKG